MTSYRTTKDVICAKNVRWFRSTYIVQNSSYLETLLLKLQWHTRIYGETFHVNSSANNANYLKFYGQKVKSKEITILVIIREISDSNLETGRYGSKSGVSQIIRESWQHWKIQRLITWLMNLFSIGQWINCVFEYYLALFVVPLVTRCQFLWWL